MFVARFGKAGSGGSVWGLQLSVKCLSGAESWSRGTGIRHPTQNEAQGRCLRREVSRDRGGESVSDDPRGSERESADDRESGPGDSIVGCGISAGEVDLVKRSFSCAAELSVLSDFRSAFHVVSLLPFFRPFRASSAFRFPSPTACACGLHSLAGFAAAVKQSSVFRHWKDRSVRPTRALLLPNF